MSGETGQDEEEEEGLVKESFTNIEMICIDVALF